LGNIRAAIPVLHQASRPSGSAHRCVRRHHRGHGESLVRKGRVLEHRRKRLRRPGCKPRS
jgi:hypothetical protein